MLKKDYVEKLQRQLAEMRENGDLTEVKAPRYERDAKAANKSERLAFLSRLTGKASKPTTHWDQ